MLKYRGVSAATMISVARGALWKGSQAAMTTIHPKVTRREEARLAMAGDEAKANRVVHWPRQASQRQGGEHCAWSTTGSCSIQGEKASAPSDKAEGGKARLRDPAKAKARGNESEPKY